MKFNLMKQSRYFHHSVFKIMIILLMTVNFCKADDSHNDQQTMLSLHNKLRALHHAPSLVWDDTLASFAESYASKCKFKHSGSSYGENLAAGYPTVSEAINVWYAEQKYYSYGRPGFSYNTGHFTQLVWRGTQKIGCAYVACNGNNGTPGNYLVCEYSPAGNISSRAYFSNNVLPRINS